MKQFALTCQLRIGVVMSGLCGFAIIPATVIFALAMVAIPMMLSEPSFTMLSASTVAVKVLTTAIQASLPVMLKLGLAFTVFAYAIAFCKLNEALQADAGEIPCGQ